MKLWKCMWLKFIYSEKATKFCKITSTDCSATVEILQHFVAFSEYTKFIFS